MQTTEVPLDELRRTLDELSAHHGRWLASVAVLWPDLEVQSAIDNLPLLAMTAEYENGEPTIVIEAGQADGERVSHVVHEVTHLRVARLLEEGDVSLEIRSTGGTTSVLRLRSPSRSGELQP